MRSVPKQLHNNHFLFLCQSMEDCGIILTWHSEKRKIISMIQANCDLSLGH